MLLRECLFGLRSLSRCIALAANLATRTNVPRTVPIASQITVFDEALSILIYAYRDGVVVQAAVPDDRISAPSDLYSRERVRADLAALDRAATLLVHIDSGGLAVVNLAVPDVRVTAPCDLHSRETV